MIRVVGVIPDEDISSARNVRSKPQKPQRAFAVGRICMNEDCDTILSKYNAADHCYRHIPPKYLKLYNRKR